MTGKVLVAYASKYGSTAEIAERIGETLAAAGVAAEVLPVEKVGDVSSYKAVVLGSGVYAGSWLKEAAKVVESQEKALAGRPVWFFSSGPTGKGDPAELMKGWKFPAALQPVADRIKPRDIKILHGSLDEKKVNFAEKLILKAIKAPVGDFRDWDAVKTWAAQIARDLAA